jgi:uncharacterized protein (TIGR03083 family)
VRRRDREVTIGRLRSALEAFIGGIERLPPERFLARSNGWSPRDVAAHLIGWHRLTIEGAELLRRGAMPPYFADGENDYATLNEGLVRRYEETDRARVVAELRASLAELEGYVRGLPADAWSADTGVRYRGEPTTIANSVAALIGDVVAHREDIDG